MIILTLLDPKHRTPLQQWRFTTESSIRIGRSADNHVVLGDRTVSRHHLELRKSQVAGTDPAGTWYVINRSLNGAYLNGECLTDRAVLVASDPGNLIQLARQGPLLRCQVLATARPPSGQLYDEQRPDGPKAIAPSSSYCSHAGNAPTNLFCIHCGWPIQVAKTVRQYQVLRILGRGGMGTTYLAWHPSPPVHQTKPSGRLLVLKEMNTDVAHIPKVQELFEREAKTLRMLNHPGIPRFYDFFMEAGQKYLVMELVHGQDLDHWVKKHGPPPPHQAIAWMIQTCEVLHYLHQQDPAIIHRDVKPGNLMLRTTDRKIVVLDFGAVKALGLTPGTRIGAEGFMAPEQAQGRPTIQSDIYAVGASLLFLLTGKNPKLFSKPDGTFSYCIQLGEMPPLPLVLQHVIEKATAPRLQERYKTAEELAQTLRNCLTELSQNPGKV